MRNDSFTQGWKLVPLRLLVGFGFAAHGWAKLSRGPDSFAGVMASLGVPQPHIMAWATSLIEFIGGISLMAGAFVVAISVPLAVIMITAMVTVHLRYGYSSVRLQAVTDAGAQFGPVGYELNLLYLAALVTLVALGPGSFSVDGWLSNRRSGRRAALPRPE